MHETSALDEHSRAVLPDPKQSGNTMAEPDESQPNSSGGRAWLQGGAVLLLVLIVIGNLMLATMGLLGNSRPRGYLFLFLAWSMGITGLVMLARLWRALVSQQESQPPEPPT
jgi:hypothetical protein